MTVRECYFASLPEGCSGAVVGLGGGRPGTSEVPNTSRAGLFVSATCAAVAAVESAAVPHTNVASRTTAPTTADAAMERGGHTSSGLYWFPARNVSTEVPSRTARRARDFIQNPPQIIWLPAG